MATKQKPPTDDATAAEDQPRDDPSAPDAETRGDREARAEQELYAFPIPAEYKGHPGVGLLMDACTLYGIDPSPLRKIGHPANPRHLLNWKHYPGDLQVGEPERVVIVTAGGLKLSQPANEDTIDTLRRVFHCYRDVNKPGGVVESVIDPLPEDLTLPTTNVTGLVVAKDHVFKEGYLRSGGATEAAKREARKKAGL